MCLEETMLKLFTLYLISLLKHHSCHLELWLKIMFLAPFNISSFTVIVLRNNDRAVVMSSMFQALMQKDLFFLQKNVFFFKCNWRTSVSLLNVFLKTSKTIFSNFSVNLVFQQNLHPSSVSTYPALRAARGEGVVHPGQVTRNRHQHNGHISRCLNLFLEGLKGCAYLKKQQKTKQNKLQLSHSQ